MTIFFSFSHKTIQQSFQIKSHRFSETDIFYKRRNLNTRTRKSFPSTIATETEKCSNINVRNLSVLANL